MNIPKKGKQVETELEKALNEAMENRENGLSPDPNEVERNDD